MKYHRLLFGQKPKPNARLGQIEQNNRRLDDSGDNVPLVSASAKLVNIFTMQSTQLIYLFFMM